MKLRGTLSLIALALATAVLLPAAAGASTARGVVVANQHGTLLVTTSSGLLRAIPGHAALGSRVVLGVRGVTVVGRTRVAIVRGIVVRRIGPTLLLSSNHHLLAIHTRRLAATTPSTVTTGPTPGTVVTETVDIENDSLNEGNEVEDGQVSAQALTVQATVAAVGTGTVTLNVQGQTLTVPLPGGLTLPSSLVGQTVSLQLSLQDDQGDDEQGDSGAQNGGDD